MKLLKYKMHKPKTYKSQYICRQWWHSNEPLGSLKDKESFHQPSDYSFLMALLQGVLHNLLKFLSETVQQLDFIHL
jgi:hypothetical protein